MVLDFTLLAYTLLAVHILVALVSATAGYFVVRKIIRGIKTYKAELNAKRTAMQRRTNVKVCTMPSGA